jgi:hypothetical protein
MRRIIRGLFVCMVLLAIGRSSWGQTNDLRTWYTIGLESELFKLVDVSVTPEIRLWDNSSRFEGFLTEADLSIPVFNVLRFGLNYRYQADFENDDQVRQSNRFGVYGEASQKIQRFRLTYRAFYDQEYTDMNNAELGKVPVVQHRHKISIRYRNKNWKLSPAASAEMFFTMSPEWAASQEKLRLSAGIQYEITRRLALGLGYKFQQEFFENNPLASHILYLELNFNLERQKSKYKNI